MVLEDFLLSVCWKRVGCANIWLFSENEVQYVADAIWRNSTVYLNSMIR
jgi:hypothetical protein